MNLEELFQAGEINNYFYRQLSRPNFLSLPKHLQEEYVEHAQIMSQQNINSADEQRVFYHIMHLAPDILHEVVVPGGMRMDLLPDLYAEIYSNQDKYPIDNLLNFFKAVAVAASKLGMKVRPQQTPMKLAYPIGTGIQQIYQPYDISKWMQATGDIYTRVRSGEDSNKAFNVITANWDKMEQIDYKHWLRFYQEGMADKYKTAAADWSEDSWLQSPIDYTNIKSQLPSPRKDALKEEVKEELNPQPEIPKKPDQNEVRDKIETQRSRIISRLNSAEKLLASLEGQFFAGDDQEFMLQLLQDLKRKVQTSNKITIKSSLFEDYIYRAANFLNSNGKKKASAFFYKIAEAPDLLADLAATPASPAPAALPEGTPAALPTEAVASPAAQPVTPPESETQQAFDEFFKRLRTGMPIDVEAADETALITVYAQAEPMPTIPQEEAPIEVQEPEDEASAAPQAAKQENRVDVALEQALSSVNIADVIQKLENLIGLFNNRTISKELGIVDLMLDKLGLSAFFPTLGEASRSALESGTYVNTRLQEIVSKLKSSTKVESGEKIADDITPNAPSPESAVIKQNLEQQQNEDQAKKIRRKEIEDAKLEGKPEATGVGAVAPEELQQPIATEPPVAPAIPR
jgi:hypothetical protein